MSKAGKETVATVKGPSEPGKESEVSVNTGKQNFNISKTKLKPVSAEPTTAEPIPGVTDPSKVTTTKGIDPTATDPELKMAAKKGTDPAGAKLSGRVKKAIATVKGAGLKVSSGDGAEL